VLIEFVVGVLFAAATVWFVLHPILVPRLESSIIADGLVMDDDGDDPDDDFSSRAVALRALREIEFDRATGKLSDADYDALRAKYTAEALAALREGDEGRATREGATSGPTRPPSPVPRLSCPTPGPRPEPEAAFCSDCGRRLGTAPGYCARCGSALEREARYCHGCGTRVAA
jgi:hypothetical protein